MFVKTLGRKRIAFFLLILFLLNINFSQAALPGSNWTATHISFDGHGRYYGYAICASSDAVNVYAYTGGNVYISNDSGVTWREKTLPDVLNWGASIACSPDGTRVFVSDQYNGYFYVSNDSGNSWVKSSPFTAQATKICSSTNGLKVAAVVSGYIYTSNDGGQSWTQRTSAGERGWSGLACSTDGTKIVAAVQNGYIYTSIDSGQNWVEQTSPGSNNWNGITLSSTGDKLAATIDEGNIYTATYSGGVWTWTQRVMSGGKWWRNICSSSDGTVINVFENNNRYLYRSTNSGANWTNISMTGGSGLICDTTGSKLIASSGGDYGSIYTSINGGTSWTERKGAGYMRWQDICSSSDGVKLAAISWGSYDDSGSVYTSSDSGTTWAQKTISGIHNWSSICSSADGTKLIVADASNGFIYTSSDSGQTWTERTSVTNTWKSMDCSSDGSKVVLVGTSGYIYTSTDGGANFTMQEGAGNRIWAGDVYSSSDGQKLVALGSGSREYRNSIYTSSDYGQSWTEHPIPMQEIRDWLYVCLSKDGTKILATCNQPNSIYISTDFGVTWQVQSELGNNIGLSKLILSADGTKIAALKSGSSNYSIVYSSNSGATWRDMTDSISSEWVGLSMSSDGTKLAAISSIYRNIYTSSGQFIGTIPTISGISSGIYNTDQTFTLSGATGASFEYSLDNGANWQAYSGPVTITAEGSYVVVAHQKDISGDQSEDTPVVRLIIDKTAPDNPLVSGSDMTNDTTPTWIWVSGTVSGNGTYRYKLDNNDLTSGATVTTQKNYTSVEALGDGAHTLYVQERDAAGNWSASGSKAIVVDSSLQMGYELLASDRAANNAFGSGVSIYGDYAVVGAYGANSARGKAYIFKRSGTDWVEQSPILSGSDITAAAYFGLSVSIYGDYIAVGAPINNAVYIFKNNSSVWTQEAIITANGSSYFGISVALYDDCLAIGSMGENSMQGAAYIYRRSGATWTQEARITASDGAASDVFGWPVVVYQDRVIAGAYGNNSNQGAAYVFKKNGSTWEQEAKLTAADGASSDYFGKAIAFDNNYIFVGAPNNSGTLGAVYEYTFNGTNWSQVNKLTATGGISGDLFGGGLALKNNDLLISSIGYNTNQGKIYLFKNGTGGWAQDRVLLTDDSQSEDYLGGIINFGGSLAVNGDYVIAGALGHDHGLSNAGSAYIFNISSGAAPDTSPPGVPGTLSNIVSSVANPTLLNFPEATDETGLDTNGYDIYWGLSSTGEDVTLTGQLSEYDPPLLTSYGIYYLRARAKDLAGNYGAWQTICSYTYQAPPVTVTELAKQFENESGVDQNDLTALDDVYLAGLVPSSNELQARIHIDKNALGVAQLVSNNFSDIEISKKSDGTTFIAVPSTGYLGSIVNTAKNNSTPIWLNLQMIFNSTRRPIITLDTGGGAQAITDYDFNQKDGIDRLRNISYVNNRLSFEVNEFSTYGLTYIQSVDFPDSQITTTNFNSDQVLTINVLDTNGEGVENAPVTFSIQSGSGQLNGNTGPIVIRTNASGVATINYTYPNQGGSNVVRAIVDDVFDTIIMNIPGGLSTQELALYNAWVSNNSYVVGDQQDDDDGDGVVNLLEWNWGVDPTVPTDPDSDNDGLNDKWDAYPNNGSLKVFDTNLNPEIQATENFTGVANNATIIAPSPNLKLVYGTHERFSTTDIIADDTKTVLKISGLAYESVRDGNLAFASTTYDLSRNIYKGLKPGETYSVGFAYINRGNAIDTYLSTVNLVQASNRWSRNYSNSGLNNVAAWQAANLEVSALPENALAFERVTLNVEIGLPGNITAVSYNRFVNAYPNNTFANLGYYGGEHDFGYSFTLEAEGYSLRFLAKTVTVNMPSNYTGTPVSGNLVPGAKVKYAITIKNNNSSVATSVNIRDKIPNNCHLFYTDTPSVVGAASWAWQGATNNTADKDTVDAVKYEITIPARGTVTASYTVTVD